MLVSLKGAVTYSSQAHIIQIEVEHRNGFPGFEVVGLADKAIHESRERIFEAIRNSDFDLKMRRVVCNLAPANIKKNGTYLDLPIAIGILASSGLATIVQMDSWLVLGELGFNAEVRANQNVLNIILKAKESGIEHILLPKENLKDVEFIEGLSFYPVSSLLEALSAIHGELIPIKGKPHFEASTPSEIDFKDIKGQESAKRAAEIAAAGFHNLLLIGSPGVGKSMIAKRITTIMPPLSFEEAVEVTQIHGIDSTRSGFKGGLIHERVFRNPHHSSSEVSIIGGGSVPKPGEISLAHRGVLFLDEMPEFKRSVFESLREPLEDGLVTIARSESSQSFLAKFLLVGAMNPCPCGYFFHSTKPCSCQKGDITKYLKKISGPILDRIDIQIQMSDISFQEIRRTGESSESIQERVMKAYQKQAMRLGKGNFNGLMSIKQIEAFCTISPSSEKLLQLAIEKFKFSMRSYHKILKVARTIADLEEEEMIQEPHLMEALQYRSLEKLTF